MKSVLKHAKSARNIIDSTARLKIIRDTRVTAIKPFYCSLALIGLDSSFAWR